MICKPCKHAGIMLTTGYSETEVVLAHKKCEAPSTCPCQHRTESLVKND